MPIYEFNCQCGHSFETVCSIEDRTKQRCPLCKSRKLNQEFHAPFHIDSYSPLHPRRGRGKGINATFRRNK